MRNIYTLYTWPRPQYHTPTPKANQSLGPTNGLKSTITGTSLVAQWLRIRLPMQGTRVQALVQEDPTCRGATKPSCHNYGACALQPISHNYRACVPQLLKPVRLEPVLHNKEKPLAMRSPCTTAKSRPRSPQLEKARTQHRRPNATKNKSIKKINK